MPLEDLGHVLAHVAQSITPQVLHVGDAGHQLRKAATQTTLTIFIRAYRGRDAHYWAPPAQIRTSPIKASGSRLGCLTAKRRRGHG